MDQNDFRALLNSIHSSNSSSVHQPAQHRPRPGRSANLRTEATYYHPKPPSKASSSATQHPPSNLKRPPQRSRGNQYRDRASERRQGLEGDFAEAEHLLKNFQSRVSAAEGQVDKKLLEQQTKYLGGDERHTILVKGLDHALYERRKAELGTKNSEITDDDLEKTYQEQSKLNQPSLAASSSDRGERQGPKKKTRDELLAELKLATAKSLPEHPAGPDLVVVERLKSMGKFKPIGSSPGGSNKMGRKAQDEEECRRRKEEKRKKKKRKREKERAKQGDRGSEASVTASEAAARSAPPQSEPHLVKLSPPNEALDLLEPTKPSCSTPQSPPSFRHGQEDTPAETQPALTTDTPKPLADDKDVDIFDEAGSYKGFDDDSSSFSDQDKSQHGEAKCSITTAEVAGGKWEEGNKRKRRTYFEDEDDCHADDRPSEPDRSLAQAPTDHPPPAQPQPRESQAHDSFPNDEPPVNKPTRLEGFSNSTDIKTLLALDKAQTKSALKRARKKKTGGTVTDEFSDDDDERHHQHKRGTAAAGDEAKLQKNLKDRLNKDVIEMENYLKKKNEQKP